MPFDIDELTWRPGNDGGEARTLSDALGVATVERVERAGSGIPDLRVHLSFIDRTTKHNWSGYRSIEVEFGLMKHDGTVEAEAKIEKIAEPEYPPGFAYVTLSIPVTPEVFTDDDYPEVLTETP